MFRAIKLTGMNRFNALSRSFHLKQNFGVNSLINVSCKGFKIRRKETVMNYGKRVEGMEQVNEERLNNKIELAEFFDKKYCDKFNEVQPQGENKQVLETYYIPLADEDYVYLAYFNENIHQSICSGGKNALYNEIQNYNKTKPTDKPSINFDFVPLSEEEINSLKTLFPFIVANNDAMNFVLQQGKKFFTYLQNVKIKEDTLRTQQMKVIDNFHRVAKVVDKNPFSTQVSSDFPFFQDTPFISLLNNYYGIKDSELCKRFEDIYFNYFDHLVSSVNGTEAKSPNVTSQLENEFLQNTQTYIDLHKKNGIKLAFEKENESDKQNESEIGRKTAPESTSSFLFDKTIFKGISTDRSKNGYYFDYNLYVEPANSLKFYKHKFFEKPFAGFYANKRLSSPSERFKLDPYNPNAAHELKFEMMQNRMQIVLRYYMFINHPYKLIKINDQNSKDNSEIKYTNEFGYNHLLIFENQLISPSHLNLNNCDFQDLLLRSRYYPEDWKLVDIDNFMEGNKLIKDKNNYEDILTDLDRYNTGKLSITDVLNSYKRKTLDRVLDSMQEINLFEKFGFLNEKIANHMTILQKVYNEHKKKKNEKIASEQKQDMLLTKKEKKAKLAAAAKSTSTKSNKIKNPNKKKNIEVEEEDKSRGLMVSQECLSDINALKAIKKLLEEKMRVLSKLDQEVDVIIDEKEVDEFVENCSKYENLQILAKEGNVKKLKIIIRVKNVPQKATPVITSLSQGYKSMHLVERNLDHRKIHSFQKKILLDAYEQSFPEDAKKLNPQDPLERVRLPKLSLSEINSLFEFVYEGETANSSNPEVLEQKKNIINGILKLIETKVYVEDLKDELGGINFSSKAEKIEKIKDKMVDNTEIRLSSKKLDWLRDQRISPKEEASKQESTPSPTNNVPMTKREKRAKRVEIKREFRRVKNGELRRQIDKEFEELGIYKNKFEKEFAKVLREKYFIRHQDWLISQLKLEGRKTRTENFVDQYNLDR